MVAAARVLALAYCIAVAALVWLMGPRPGPEGLESVPRCSLTDNVRVSYWVARFLMRGLLWPRRPDARGCSAPWVHVPEQELFSDLRARYGRVVVVRVWGTPLLLLTDGDDVRQMLDDSPSKLHAGELKLRFFRGLMEGNVGVSHGPHWRRRRELTERCMPSAETLKSAVRGIVDSLDAMPCDASELREPVTNM